MLVLKPLLADGAFRGKMENAPWWEQKIKMAFTVLLLEMMNMTTTNWPQKTAR
jgi:hypothetical protein